MSSEPNSGGNELGLSESIESKGRRPSVWFDGEDFLVAMLFAKAVSRRVKQLP